MPLSTFIWGTPARKITTTCTMIAAIAGAIVAVPPAWDALALPEIATHVFVHQLVDPMQVAQNETTRAVYQLQLQNLQGSLYAAQRDQETAPSQTVTQRIQDLQQQIQKTQQKLNAPGR